jgi:hypothetical protein
MHVFGGANLRAILVLGDILTTVLLLLAVLEILGKELLFKLFLVDGLVVLVSTFFGAADEVGGTQDHDFLV